MLLKIRDDVDLKELEKFGFKKWILENANVNYTDLNNEHYNRNVYKDRTLGISFPIGIPVPCIKEESFFEDLIEAGLVEEVEK